MQDCGSEERNESSNKEKENTEKGDENAVGETSPSGNANSNNNNAAQEEQPAAAASALSFDEDKEVESDAADDDDETKENYEGFNGTGRTVTLQMLMSANVLQPGKSTMTIEYLGQKFVGDLLPDGKIKSQETETIFLTPSAWAMHCKRIINPEKKSGCGWASVKYKGKKLDAYKNSWLRKCALQKESTPDDCEPDIDKKSDSPLPVVKRTIFQHNTVCNRNIMHDANMLIEAVPFTTVGKLQPFLLTISSSAMLLTDFHCHLSMREVCGYLGGTWDVNSHTLAITKAYPCRNTRFDRRKAADVEREIQKLMLRDQLILVGWYHSHPQFQAEPTLRDCDSQLEYQIRMRGPTEATYTPCVALIVSPYYDENPTLESVVKAIWVVPPNENKQSVEYGRPMLMQYSVLPDKEVPEEVRTEIQSCVDYYTQFRNEIVKFRNMFNDETTYIEKLKNTLYPKFPLKQNDKALWNWLCAVLDCEQEDDFIPPKTIKIIDVDSNSNKEEVKTEVVLPSMALNELKMEDIKDDNLTLDQKSNELKVMSLQEQLCLPSGLNMNPIRMLSPLATPNPTAPAVATAATTAAAVPAVNTTTAASTIVPMTTIMPPIIVPGITPLPTTTATSTLPLVATQTPPQAVALTMPQLPNQLPLALTGASPRDSPITIPSTSASPAKFEVPVRASPSPAKSDTSSSHTSRTRNSPAPSPGKFSISDLARNSPTGNIVPQTTAAGLIPSSASCLPTANDLMAASLAQLAGQLPPNFLQSDIAAALFQQQRGAGTGMSNSSLNQLAAAAAKVGGQKNSAGSGLPDLHDPNVAAAAAAAFSNTFNLPPRLPESTAARTTKAERSSKSSGSSSSSSSSSNSSSNSYKTKLMKELDDLKNDPLKMSELMRSPEYAALLLQQAEALGATTLGTLGFGTDFSYLTSANLGLTGAGSSSQSNSVASTSNSSNSKSKAAAAASAAALTADYNNLIQASKLLGYDAYMQQMAAAAVAAASVPPPASPSNSKKQQQQQQAAQQQQQHPDYTALLQTYSKLFDPGNQLSAALTPGKSGAGAGMHHELSALLAAGVGGLGGLMPTGNTSASNSAKQKQQQKQQQEMQQQQTDMLNQLLQSEKQQSELNAALLYHQNKAAADLNALFAQPPVSAGSVGGGKSAGNSGSGSAANSTGAPSPLTDPAAYYNALAQEKMQDYAAFFQQHHGKYGSIPDPLSKSTLAANNLFMSPSALLKIQQESLSAMMMKPPKSTTPSGSASAGSLSGRGGRESSASPALERLTPTKSATSGSKYNFSAVDLAISSVPSNTPSPAPSDGSNSSSHRRPSNTPPVDLSRLYGELSAVPHALAGTKKRMEFSSIADLAAPPPAKVPKTSDDVLNLSNE